MINTVTGNDRISAPLHGIEGAVIAHKTGSGYRTPAGRLIAFNDVAHIMLPNGFDYTLAIMITDFVGSEEDAAKVMADISKLVLEYSKRD